MIMIGLLACAHDSSKDDGCPLAVESVDPTGHSPISATRLATIGDSLTFGRLTSLRWLNDSIVAATDAEGRYRIHLVDVTRRSTHASFGRQGFGPGEYVDPRWIEQVATSDSSLWIFDPSVGRLSEVRLTPPDSIGSVKRQMILRIPHRAQSVHRVGDSLIAVALAPDRLLMLLDSTGRFRRWLPFRGDVSADSLPHVGGRTRLNRVRMVVEPDRGRLALAHQMRARIDYLDRDGCVEASARGPVTVAAQYDLQRRDGGLVFTYGKNFEFAYVGVDASSAYLFSLFCGSCSNENRLANEIHVFSFGGGFVGSIELDGAGVYAIAVSRDGRFLVGAEEEPFPRIGLWQLGSYPGSMRDIDERFSPRR